MTGQYNFVARETAIQQGFEFTGQHKCVPVQVDGKTGEKQSYVMRFFEKKNEPLL
jgi:hypothetical protein